MKYIYFLLLLVAVNCTAQKKKPGIVKMKGQNGAPITADPIGFVAVTTFTSVMGSNILFLEDRNGDMTVPNWIIQIKRDTIAYEDVNKNIIIKDTMATIRELLLYIQLKEKSMAGVLKELDNSYSTNRKLVKAYDNMIDTQKKAWKELIDKLTVKK